PIYDDVEPVGGVVDLRAQCDPVRDLGAVPAAVVGADELDLLDLITHRAPPPTWGDVGSCDAMASRLGTLIEDVLSVREELRFGRELQLPAFSMERAYIPHPLVLVTLGQRPSRTPASTGR